MFSNKAQLTKRTPQNGVDRENYLSLLVDEYINTSSSFDAKCQVLANLANFAYDPINYTYIRNVGVLDIFIHVLKNETNTKLLNFATAGICNLCVDPENIDYLLENNALILLKPLLKSEHFETVADTITIFIYLCNSHAKEKLNITELSSEMETLKLSTSPIVSNLASVFLNEIVLF